MGVITVLWPHNLDSDWYEGLGGDVKSVVDFLNKGNLNHRFTSSFIEWQGEKGTAESVRSELKKVPIF